MSAYPSLLLDNCCIVRIAPHVADMGSQLSYIPSSLSSYLYLSCHLSLSRVKQEESKGAQHMVLAFVAGFGGFVMVMFAGRVVRNRYGNGTPSFME